MTDKQVTLNAIKCNIARAEHYLSLDKQVNIIYFAQTDRDIPAVSVIGDPNMLIAACDSIVHNITKMLNGAPVYGADEALLKTINYAINDMYYGGVGNE